ncbi:hypothetical protein DRO55_04800 [Candidatus Bathyarchaeota archaeon]|nr:MAG: hypothetical protein DRO55_04800 [Candidatus Bathyarchaeota archaeon]
MDDVGKLRVHLEFGDAKLDLEGDVNEVFKALTRFITKIYPDLEVVRNLTYTPDLVELSEELSGIIELTPEGPILISGEQLSARNKICLALVGAEVGSRLGKLAKGTLSSRELSRVTGKAIKTVMNEMPRLVAEGLVKRTSKGEYMITTLGIKRTEDLIREYKAKIESS